LPPLHLHVARQPGGDFRHGVDDQHGGDHQQEHGQRHARQIGQLFPGHAGQHEQVETHGWRDLRHFDDKDQEDAEPDQIYASGVDGGQQQAHGQHDDGNAVQEAAEHDVEHHQRQDEAELRKAQRAYPFRQGARQADIAHRQRQELRAGQDQGDHAIQPCRAHERVLEDRPAERTLHRREDERADHADGGGFRGRRETGVDGSQHDGDQYDDRNQVPRPVDFLGEAQAFVGLRDPARMQQGPDRDIAHEQAGQHQARQDAGNEQLGNGGVGRHAIDDHDDGGRYEQPQRAGPRQGADDLVLRIAAADELRHGHLAYGRAGGGGRTRYRGEDGAAHDIGVQQPPRYAVQPGRQALEEILRQAGAEQYLAHPEKQRQGGQRPARGGAPDGDGHGVAGRPAGRELHAQPAR